MYTGIVTGLGRVVRIEKRGDTHITIAAEEGRTLGIGDSISCSGVCLTVVARGDGAEPWFSVTASAETLSRTNLGAWREGTPVNLERPLKVGDELGGHILTGHVDGVAELVTAVPEGESMRMTFAVPGELARFIAPKGSIALDGVSLTVNEVEGARFGVNIIPHTAKVTTFGSLKPGSRANLEVDVLARYVARLAEARG